MPQPIELQSIQNEGRTALAIQSIKQGQSESIRSIATSYDIPRTTLRRRVKGMPSRRDSIPNSRKLSPYEETAVVQRILDLDSRGFPPRPQGVEEMANHLLAERGATPVGKNWTTNFIKRRTELKTKFSRRYDYKRAQCEDPEVIGDWFRLVRNVVAKYGILEQDIFNFDEAGFAMGVVATAKVVTSSERKNRPKTTQPGNREWVTIIQGINSYGWTIPPLIIFKAKAYLAAWYKDSDLPRDWVITRSENGWTTNEIGLEWSKHFDQFTKDRTTGRYRLLILDGHESHLSVQFQEFCKEKDIITLCMPPHSSHILQPLDVGCFGPLKKAYGKQIENLVRVRINHITKLEFLPAFHEAFKAAFSEQNIKSGFRATGLVPYDPENVLAHLDFKLRTPTPDSEEGVNWTSKTPQNLKEVESQSTHIKGRIVRHQDSSPGPINDAFDQLIKGVYVIAYSAPLLKTEVKALQAANQVKTRKERKRKHRIAQEGGLSIRTGQEILEDAEVEAQIEQEGQRFIVRPDGSEAKQRRCGNCNEFGHNMRTCARR